MPFGIDGKAEARFGNGAFLAHAGQHVGKWPALGHVIGGVADRDQRRMKALAEFGQQAEPARLVAAMIDGRRRGRCGLVLSGRGPRGAR